MGMDLIKTLQATGMGMEAASQALVTFSTWRKAWMPSGR